MFQSFVYKFQCGLCNEPYYGECARHLSVRIGEHISIPITTAQKTNHLLFSNHSPSSDNLSMLKCTYSAVPSNKICVKILFAFNSYYVTRYYLTLLIELFVIWSCVSVWAPLVVLVRLFNLLSWSWDWTLPLSRVVIYLL